ncbi:MAG: A/G-specific adenine glycosylase [Deltaproteobacteria bacterium]|nr:A/G-specific adenine glycosylase [Deltaproteobacteria bacterium]
MQPDRPTLETLRDGLRGWYLARRRRLPWRDEPTPYRVWLSEIMLQQTQVATVIPYFERFVATFPTVEALAAAPEEDVLALWAGLGYYRRCRALHEAAKAIVRDHGGALPASLDALLALPGVGRYTAGAIASIAFGLRAPLVDGNVARVLARLTALEPTQESAAGQKALWALADALVDPVDPSTHNQALMELGALVCSPRSPDCGACPWHDGCRARATGDPESYPRRAPKRAPTAMSAVGGLATRDDGAMLLARRPDGGLLGGLWELPGGEHARGDGSRKDAVERWFAERLGLAVDVRSHVASVTHVFTHRRLALEIYAVDGADRLAPRPTWYTEARWVTAGEVAALPLSRLTEKVLAAVEGRAR